MHNGRGADAGDDAGNTRLEPFNVLSQPSARRNNSDLGDGLEGGLGVSGERFLTIYNDLGGGLEDVLGVFSRAVSDK